MTDLVRVRAADEIDDEDVMRFDGMATFAIFRTEGGYFATDGFCTHEKQHRSDGLVIGRVIECPLHGGRFDVTTGKALSAPVCIDLHTYDVKVEDGQVFLTVEVRRAHR